MSEPKKPTITEMCELTTEERLQFVEDDCKRLWRQRSEDECNRHQRFNGMLMGFAIAVWVIVLLRSLQIKGE